MCPLLLLSSQFFLWRPRYLLPSMVYCRMVFAMMLCRVVWRNWESLHRFTVANKGSCFPAGIHLLSHIFVCLVFSLRNTEESPEAFRFKCLYTSLCLYCQSPAFASVEVDRYSELSVESKLGFEADVSALPDGVKS